MNYKCVYVKGKNREKYHAFSPFDDHLIGGRIPRPKQKRCTKNTNGDVTITKSTNPKWFSRFSSRNFDVKEKGRTGLRRHMIFFSVPRLLRNVTHVRG